MRGKVEASREAYGGWQGCWRLSNGLVDLVATTQVGPRLIYFGFSGEANVFKEFPAMLGKTGGREWRIYGGHRLWQAPESKAVTYAPDNAPLQSAWQGGRLRLTQPPAGGVEKEMIVSLAPGKPAARVLHRLRNRGPKPVTLAPWALSVMAPGGLAVLPLAKGKPGLLPSQTLSLWPYTDMKDPRWTWGRDAILLRQDPKAATAQKVGYPGRPGWLAYCNRDAAFIKKFEHRENGVYPDFGSSVEAYTNPGFLEAETLGPLAMLRPGQSAEHVEDWFLARLPGKISSEADVRRSLLPLVSRLR